MRLKLRDKEVVETAQDGRKGGLRSAAEVAAGWHASTRRSAQLLQLLDPVISLAPPVQTMSVGQPPITAWPVRQARSGLKVKGDRGGAAFSNYFKHWARRSAADRWPESASWLMNMSATLPSHLHDDFDVTVKTGTYVMTCRLLYIWNEVHLTWYRKKNDLLDVII